MRIGPLRHRVTFKRKPNQSQNSKGENVVGFTTKDFTCWAAVDDMGQLTGRKLMVAQQILAEGDHLVRTRYRTGMNAYKQIVTVVGGRVFDVQSLVNVDERDRELWFRCTETNPAP